MIYKKHFYASFVLAFILITIACGLYFFSMTRLVKQQQAVVTTSAGISAASRLRTEIYNLYHLHKLSLDKGLYNKLILGYAATNISEAMNNAAKNPANPLQQKYLATMTPIFSDYISLTQDIEAKLSKKIGHSDISLADTTRANTLMDNLITVTVAFSQASESDIGKMLSENSNYKIQTLALMLGLIIGCLFLFAFVFRITVRAYSHTIDQFKNTLDMAKQGNFSHPVSTVAAGDKIGELATGINQMITKMQSMTTEQETLDSQTKQDRIFKSFNRCLELRDILQSYHALAAPQSANINLSRVIEETCELFSRVSPPTITVRNSVSKQLRPVPGVYTEWVDILLGLGINAMEAMPNGGTLQFRAINKMIERDGEIGKLTRGIYNWIMVADSGTGLKADYLQKLFDPEFSTKEARRGMGLFEIKQKIEAMGGSIVVETSPDHGTDIHIFVPSINKVAEVA